jgi:hypothetical protein
MSAKIAWKGAALRAKKARQLVQALTEIDQRIETEAKAELYPGHGKRSGTLQRAIAGDAAHEEGDRIRGSVGVRGVRYALRIHRLYRYISEGLGRVKPIALDIVRKHCQ